jgi:molybdopterin-guanine dinucleotide biosynthesis protein A
MNKTPYPDDLYGLILAGGQSSRMGEDKALLSYQGQDQLSHSFDLLNQVCAKSFVSVSKDNAREQHRQAYPQIIDHFDSGGPLNGIASAFNAHPDKAWLVIACDLPLLDESTLQYLLEHRQKDKEATAFISHNDGLPEPLCAIWEPRSQTRIHAALEQQRNCPRKLLIQADTELLQLPKAHALDNANTPEEQLQIKKLIAH